MRNRHVLAAALATLGAASVFAAEADRWTAPQCRRISGAPSVTATADEGATLARTQGRMARISYSFGLTPIDHPDTLLATVDAKVIRSTDGGCTWSPLVDLTRATGNELLTLTPAPGGAAYAWAVNGSHIVRIAGARATTSLAPGGSVMGLAVDAADGQHLRHGDSNGAIWDSRDGGASWTQVGALAGVFPYRIAFDPRNLDHVVLGAMSEGAFVSADGGATWQRASGLAADGKGPVNVFNIVVSPADPKVVWATGLDIDEMDGGAPSGGRHVYASRDGGRSFRPVVDQDDRVTIINGPLMVPHPTDAGVLYFVFGMSFGNYGTDLYRYDASTRQVTLTHNSYDEVSAIAFHPLDSRLMYLGLASENE